MKDLESYIEKSDGKIPLIEPKGAKPATVRCLPGDFEYFTLRGWRPKKDQKSGRKKAPGAKTANKAK